VGTQKCRSKVLELVEVLSFEKQSFIKSKIIRDRSKKPFELFDSGAVLPQTSETWAFPQNSSRKR